MAGWRHASAELPRARPHTGDPHISCNHLGDPGISPQVADTRRPDGDLTHHGRHSSDYTKRQRDCPNHSIVVTVNTDFDFLREHPTANVHAVSAAQYDAA